MARALGDPDFKRGRRMEEYRWLYPASFTRRGFSADLVSGVPDTFQVCVCSVCVSVSCVCVFFGGGTLLLTIGAQVDVQAGDEFVVLACDGLWDVMSSQRVVDIVRRHLSEGTSPEVRRQRQ